jgi:hypothetical protein
LGVGSKIDGNRRKDLGDSVSRGRAAAWGGRLGLARRAFERGGTQGHREAQRGFWGCSGDCLSEALRARGGEVAP